MLSASAATALSVSRVALCGPFTAVLLLPDVLGRRDSLDHTRQSNCWSPLIGSLHAPLRLAFLPFFNHPPITDPLPRRSFGHSSAHPLCHGVCLDLLGPHLLRHLYASRGVLLGRLSPTWLVSVLSCRYRQGSSSHRTSLRRAPLRKGRRRIRMATLGQRSRLA